LKKRTQYCLVEMIQKTRDQTVLSIALDEMLNDDQSRKTEGMMKRTMIW